MKNTIYCTQLINYCSYFICYSARILFFYTQTGISLFREPFQNKCVPVSSVHLKAYHNVTLEEKAKNQSYNLHSTEKRKKRHIHILSGF